jgi:hypothetical protein
MARIEHGITVFIPAQVVETRDYTNVVLEIAGRHLTVDGRELEKVVSTSAHYAKLREKEAALRDTIRDLEGKAEALKRVKPKKGKDKGDVEPEGTPPETGGGPEEPPETPEAA